MLAVIGVQRIEDLFDEIPPALKSSAFAALPPALSEMEVGAADDASAPLRDGRPLNFIGAGAYEHHIPAPVWAIATRGEFYSAYTPYQAEASQGTLQLIYEYQSMMCALTAHGGLECLVVRRRLGARGGLPHGGARESRLGFAPHARAAQRQSDLPAGASRRSPAIKTCASSLSTSIATRQNTLLDKLRRCERRGLDRARRAAAEFFRQRSRRSTSSPIGRTPTRCW